MKGVIIGILLGGIVGYLSGVYWTKPEAILVFDEERYSEYIRQFLPDEKEELVRYIIRKRLKEKRK